MPLTHGTHTIQHKQRIFDYDFMRFVAICFVLAIHASCLTYIATTPVQWAYTYTMRNILFTCNGLFFLLAGKFALTRQADEHISTFYMKKVSGLLIPFALLALLRTLYNLFPHYETAAHVGKEFLLALLAELNHSEYWFMFTLIPLIFAAPFLAPAFKQLSREKMNWLFALTIIWLAIHFVSSNTTLPFEWTWIFPGKYVSFFFLFCIGPSVEQYFENKRARWILYFCGLAALIACVICNYTAHTEQLNDNSPMHIALVLCMFFLLKNISHFLVFMRKPIEFVAPYVIYIYLIHMPIEYELLRAFPQLEQPNSFFIFIPFTLITLIGSFVLGLVVHTLLIKPSQKLFLFLCSRRKRT